MSGHHVGDLASSFVEMAKAYEELPRVKAELAEANRAFNHASDTIQRLELKLIDRNTTIDELHAKVREAEVARDDAELRFLEADEKLGNVAKALQTAGESVGLELRKPEPVADASAASQEEPGSTSTAPSSAYASDGTISPEPGQSVTDPTVQLDSTNQPIASSATVEQPKLAPPAPLGSSEVPPEPFSPESKPTDTVEVTITESTNTGQSDPLPTAASPIDASPAGSTNANPSGGVSSPIDEPSYANEPGDKWSTAWAIWANLMDAKYGRYNWPMRTTQA